ncbi:hypothetical protein MNEG_4484 [Monoraphidium neglectum]|uniref:BACK domain-containing protein n=1 Tax=Monoraphidium neglectum TaxID=145388 RepID=A0A0D2MKK3_9CHLO|nr:hypothetical protein MNEG_4484 [Monoraphidium neglectum]KIZ03475.1 hypothetical protein MNEG_4484 [Monoraphidium neglectum]|eukprot:XP_013902494.1 hypothetical protein MNEG_4484 [Monoraphidium neglectum]
MSGPIDFSHLFNSSENSDIKLRMVLAAPAGPDAPAAKRQRTRTGDHAAANAAPQGAASPTEGRPQRDQRRPPRAVLREFDAHSVLLDESSDYIKGMPDWGQDEPGVVDIEVEDEGEVEAAELLLKTFYSTVDAGKPLRGASQATLLQVLLLADRLCAERAVGAAVHVLLSAPADGATGPLHWDTVTAVYRLPPALADNPVLKPLFDAAAFGLHQRLGDLDAAWLDTSCRAQLLALPFAALRQLLSDERTRVSSENTVVYTVAAWVKQNASSSAEQHAELAQCVRAPRLTPLYSAAFGAQLLTSWSPAISAADMHYALASAGLPAADKAKAMSDLLQYSHLPLARHAAWRLLQRPTSRVTEAALELRPLQKLAVPCRRKSGVR